MANSGLGEELPFEDLNPNLRFSRWNCSLTQQQNSYSYLMRWYKIWMDSVEGTVFFTVTVRLPSFLCSVRHLDKEEFMSRQSLTLFSELLTCPLLQTRSLEGNEPANISKLKHGFYFFIIISNIFLNFYLPQPKQNITSKVLNKTWYLKYSNLNRIQRFNQDSRIFIMNKSKREYVPNESEIVGFKLL